jgi:hypothetical protein
MAVVYQDWLVATKGMMPRWVDLSNPGCIPRNGLSIDTLLTVRANNPSSFVYQPYLTQAASAGFLQEDIVYDFGFSYYNKLLDYETNVAYGTTVTVSAAETAMQITTFSGGSVNNAWQEMQTFASADNDSNLMPWEYSNTEAFSGAITPRGQHINDYELRFYYRETGNSEWLPAGNFDAAKLWFYPFDNFTQRALICQGAVAGLPGGQPNGFVDYSPLPKQRYICTTVFQQRAFWWSEKSMHFSLLNNIYAYPTRNITACPTGKWRGGIVHSQKDLSQQLSRLVVFGDVTYSARFTGERTIQNVRISSATVGQFEIDGSDFRMEYLCESTAFSFRSACVAEGILYWWGPQGIYRDNGIVPPGKISLILEPDIWNYVDMARDQEVCSVFNKRTKEVLWFYPPKVTDANFPTYGLAFNIENGNFYPFKMRCQVDAVQNIKLENDSTPDDVDGERAPELVQSERSKDLLF